MSTTPPPYDRQASFTNFHTESAPTVGQDLEAEFNAVKQSQDATQARLGEIQRDDGKLANLSVHPDALSSAVRSILAYDDGQIRGAWVALAVYNLRDVIEGPDGITYVAADQHVANADFNVDLNAGRWLAIDSGLALDEALREDIVDGTIEGPLRADLASALNGDGAFLVGFNALATGSVDRSMFAKTAEQVSVFDFIPVAEQAAITAGTSTYDATADIQDAINCAGARGHVFVPKGTYKITAALSMPTQGVTLFGEGRQITTIRQDTLNANVLNVSGQYCNVRGIGLSYGTGTPSGIAVLSTGNFCDYANIVVKRCGVGFKFTTGVGSKLRAFEILEYESCGVWATAVNDVWATDGILNAGNGTRGVDGGLRLTEKVEAFFATNLDILVGQYSIVTGSASYTAGARPAYCTFTNVLCDTSDKGSIVENMVESEFVGCWFSGGRSGGGFPGLTLTQNSSLKFTNTRFFNCGTHGVSVGANSGRIRFVNCAGTSNSYTAGVGVAHGFNFVGATNFSLIGCSGNNGLAAGAQGYGIAIDSACDKFSVIGCLLEGNATGGLLDSTADTGKTKFISKNVGFTTQNKGTTNVAIGQTVATVTHNLSGTPGAEDIVITPTTLMSAAGITSWRVTAMGATTFQVQTNAAVAGAAFNFGWSAKIKGA